LTKHLDGQLATKRLDPVGLDELGGAELMDRFDAKHLVSASIFAAILDAAREDYRILEVRGMRVSEYITIYYDTPARDLYLAHHRGRLPRYKVRTRCYASTGARFLEVKRRDGQGRTRKARLPWGDPDMAPLSSLLREPLLGVERAVSLDRLEPAVEIRYHRITLVHRKAPERVTLDLGLSFAVPSGSRAQSVLVQTTLPGVGIIEVKQERRWSSPVSQVLRELGVRPTRVSKYCLALATLDPSLKHNRFLPMITSVKALSARYQATNEHHDGALQTA